MDMQANQEGTERLKEALPPIISHATAQNTHAAYALSSRTFIRNHMRWLVIDSHVYRIRPTTEANYAAEQMYAVLYDEN